MRSVVVSVCEERADTPLWNVSALCMSANVLQDNHRNKVCTLSVVQSSSKRDADATTRVAQYASLRHMG